MKDFILEKEFLKQKLPYKLVMTQGTVEQMHDFPREASYKNFSSVNRVLFKYIENFYFTVWKFETRKLEALMNNYRICFQGTSPPIPTRSL